MGVWYVNLQIYTNNRNPLEVKAEVIVAYKAFLAKNYFAEVEYTEEQYYLALGDTEYSKHYDRGIVVGCVIEQNHQWISLYDQFFGGMYGKGYAEICKYLSIVLKTPVVLIYLFGGYELEMDIFADGKVIDVYNTNYSDLKSDAEQEKQRGHSDIWQTFLENVDGQALRQAWDGDFFDLRENLKDAAKTLGMDEQLVQKKWETISLDLDYSKEYQFTPLAFRSVRPPLPYATGKPVFKRQIDNRIFERNLEVGDALNFLNSTAINEGGAGKGLKITLWGEALTKGIIEVENVKVNGHGYFNPENAISGDRTFPIVKLGKRLTKKGAIILYGEVPDFEIQASLPAGDYSSNYTIAEISSRKSEAEIHINPVGHIIGPGKGDFNIAVQAIETNNLQEWSGELSVVNVQEPVNIAETAIIVPTSDTTQEILRLLKPTDKICVVVMLGPNTYSNSSYIATSIEKIMTLFAQSDERKKGSFTFWPNHERQLQKHGFLVDSFGKSSAVTNWARLRNELALCEELAGEVGSADNDPVTRAESKNWGFGFDYNRNSIYKQKEESLPPAQTLVFWKDVAGISSSDIQEIEQNLQAELDNLVEKTDGYQAFMALWSWRYSPNYFATQTLYETAKGIGNPPDLAFDNTWNRHWLRAVTENIWLGESLAEKLKIWLKEESSNVDLLQEVAKITTVGKGLRLSLKREVATLRNLDKVLIMAGFIPTKEVWQEARR